MPIAPAPYVRRPYVGDRLIRLADLGREMSRARSNYALQQGDRSAQAWAMVGNAIAQGLGAVRQEKELVPLRQAAQAKLAREQELMRREDEAYSEGRQAKSENAALLADLNQFTESYGGKRPPAEDVVKRYGVRAGEINQVLDAAFGKPKEAEPFTLNQGDVRFGPDGKQIASNPKPAEQPKLHSIVVDDGKGNPVNKLVSEEELRAGIPAYRAPKDAKEPTRFWVMRNGAPIRITEAEYKLGDQPASNREQGRPVTSGDANRIADFDTSLDDVSVLSSSLNAIGSTGARAAIGASLPNWVTEVTGWGSDAKKKQALINRVKQVIGKALEGGVLRKEDEIKYEKILPTVGDPNDLVLSKLQGLDQAIKDRRTRLIDSLSDAGYETSKYGDYQPLNKGVAAVPDLSGLQKGRGRKFTSGPFAGQTWALDEQGRPYKVGG